MPLVTRAGKSCDPSPTGQTVGWVLESPGRGTLSLILSCLTTLFLCTWVVIHARIHGNTTVHRMHKFFLLFKSILAPEFIAVEGLQEWSQARKIVNDSAPLTGEGLKLIQAFYIGMLGLRFRTPEGEKVLWPNQFIWLLEQGLVDWDDHPYWGLSEKTICDKSNADGAAKLLALCQVVWFVAQSILRWTHSLPLSQLEAMTLSYIPLFAVAYFFWWVKPKDVMTPSVVDLPDMHPRQLTTFLSMAVSESFGVLEQICSLTPRVFEKEAQQKAERDAEEQQSLEKSNQTTSSECMYRETSRERSSVKSKEVMNSSARETVLGYWDPELYHSKILWSIICFFAISFPALHLISWDTVFPTVAELWLWRAAALVSIFSMLIFIQFEKVVLRWGGLLTMISLVSPALYLLSRLVMIGGVMAAFRASDPAVYDTYTVSTYWIHVLK